MLAEFFKALTEHARKGIEPSRCVVSDTDDRVLVTHANGDHEWVEILPPAHNAKALTLDDFCAIASDNTRSPDPEVWVTFKGAVLINDKRTRRGYTTLALRTTERWAELENLENGGGMLAQKEAIQLLRRMFDFGEETALITGLRSLEFGRTSNGSSHVERGREALGRAVEERVQGMKVPVPEDFIVTTRVWRVPGLMDITAKVPMLLDLHPAQPAVEILPVPDEFERAVAAAVDELCKRLKSTLPQIPVFQGQATVRAGRATVIPTVGD